MKKKIRIILISLISIVVIFFVLVLLRRLIASSSADDTVYRARTESYENIIEISGTVAAAQEQTLQALSAGTVTAVLLIFKFKDESGYAAASPPMLIGALPTTDNVIVAALWALNLYVSVNSPSTPNIMM